METSLYHSKKQAGVNKQENQRQIKNNPFVTNLVSNPFLSANSSTEKPFLPTQKKENFFGSVKTSQSENPFLSQTNETNNTTPIQRLKEGDKQEPMGSNTNLEETQQQVEVQSKIDNGKNNIIQRYYDAKGTTSGTPYRITDDMTAAVKVGYPNHVLYAKSGKAAVSNANLSAVGSGIELEEESTSLDVIQGTQKKNLKKITVKNKQNNTEGNNMKLWDDCGDSAGVVVGGTNRTALHHNAITKGKAKTSATTPSLMKTEIMEKMMKRWLVMPSTSEETKKKIGNTLAKAVAKQLEINQTEKDFGAATTDADRERIGGIYWAKIDEYGNIMMSFYNTMSESKREEIDKYLQINKSANPNVGQGYTMSSGGQNYPRESTWNFHWGGVVMKSDDNKDNITLENYAMGGTTKVENDKWDFAMYGTEKKGQTFHEQHHDTKQHGDKPTTMVIEEK